MELTLLRMTSDEKSTLGHMFIDQEHVGFTCEDIEREVKVDGETRIPSGRYQIKLRKVLSGMTEKYREKYDWFEWHLELQDVEGFNYVYIHIGNTYKHTEGCILLGSSATPTDDGWMVGGSAKAFAPFYTRLKKVIDQGENVFISVVDLGGA